MLTKSVAGVTFNLAYILIVTFVTLYIIKTSLESWIIKEVVSVKRRANPMERGLSPK